jgi:hypothetical protein
LSRYRKRTPQLHAGQNPENESGRRHRDTDDRDSAPVYPGHNVPRENEKHSHIDPVQYPHPRILPIALTSDSVIGISISE